MQDTTSVQSMLAAVDLFEGLSARHLKAVSKLGRETLHEPGHDIAVEGLGGSAFHLILDGRAAVTVAGREVRTLGPGDYFGEISVIDGRDRTSTVTVTEPLRALSINRFDFLALLEHEPSVALHVMRQLCTRVRNQDPTSVPTQRTH